MKRVRQQIKTFLFLALFLPLIIFVHPACDCGSPDSSGDAKSDDDSIIDDDSLNDDVSDDDAGTTTTTSPTTTTGPPTSSTTTVVPTSSTTTTIPGTGTACDPFRYTATDGPDVPDFGPWPEYTIGAITYRQYVAGSAGIGRSSVALDAEGRAWVFGMVGRSFDAYVFNHDGSVERQIVDPAGGFNSIISRDDAGAFHVVYTNNNLNEIRYATNVGGEWTRTVLFSESKGGMVFGAARKADGTIHVAYLCLEWDNVGVRYFEWRDGSIQLEEQIQEPEDNVTLWGPSLALDSTGQAIVAHGGDGGVWVHQRTNSGWVSTSLAPADGETATVVDHAGNAHVFYGHWSSGLFHATNESGAWVASPFDLCNSGAVQFHASVDTSGALHVIYASRSYWDVRHATNASGAWRFEHVNEVPGYYLGAVVATDGAVHTASCAIGYGVKTFYYATKMGDGWERRRIAGRKRFGGVNLAFDEEGALHMAFTGYVEPEEWQMYYIKADGDEWLFETVDPDAVDDEPGIAVDSTGKVHIVYVDREGDDALKYAVRDESGWTVEEIHEADPGELDAFLAVDSNDRVSVGYTYDDQPLFLRLIGGQWYEETAPYIGHVREFKSNAQSKPHMLIRGDSPPWPIQYLWKSSPTTWTIESAMTPTNFAYPWIDMDLDSDEHLHSLYCCDIGTGVGYASDKSGSWNSIPLGNWMYIDDGYALTVDGANSVHMALTDTKPRPGLSDGFVLYYGNFQSNSLDYTPVDDRWDITPIVEMDLGPTGDLTMAYEAFESICTLTIDLEGGDQ